MPEFKIRTLPAFRSVALTDFSSRPAINAKDEVTHEHVLRVQIYAAGVARILGCNEGEASGENVVVNAVGGNAHLLEGRVIETGEGVTGWVLANRKPFCNADPKLDVHPHLAPRFAGYKTMAAFPIEQKGALLGALTVYSATLSEFPPSHQRLLQNVARQLSSFLTVRGETPVITPVVPSTLSDPQIESELTH